MENLSVSYKDWKTGIFPLTGKRLTLANHGRNILLSVCNNEIIATKVTEPLDPIYPDELRIDSGVFRGVDDGEFYFGEIVFYSDSGEEYQILDENFRGFYTVNNKIYVLTGLAHMGSDEGCVYLIFYQNDKWVVKKIINLKSCPNVFMQHNDETYIVTGKGIVIIKDEKIVDELISDAGWGCLYPHSILMFNDSLFVGMRGGVYEFNLKVRTGTWYDLLDSNPGLESTEWFKNLDD